MPTRKSPIKCSVVMNRRSVVVKCRSVKRRSVKRRSPKVKRSVKRSVKRRSPKVKRSVKRSVKRRSPKVKRSVKRRSPKVKRSVKRRSVKRSPVHRRRLSLSFTAKQIRDSQIRLLNDNIDKLDLEFDLLSPAERVEKRDAYVRKFRSLARRIQDVYRVEGESPPAVYEILRGWKHGSGDLSRAGANEAVDLTPRR